MKNDNALEALLRPARREPQAEPVCEALFVEGTAAALRGGLELGALFGCERAHERRERALRLRLDTLEQRLELVLEHLARAFAVAFVSLKLRSLTTRTSRRSARGRS